MTTQTMITQEAPTMLETQNTPTAHAAHAEQAATHVAVAQEDDATPSLQPAGPDFPDFGDGGGGHHTCDWEESMCDDTATHYTHCLCGDPECESDHIQYYCDRHYALKLALKLQHLRECEAYEHDEPCEANRVVTLAHIDAFGPVAI